MRPDLPSGFLLLGFRTKMLFLLARLILFDLTVIFDQTYPLSSFTSCALTESHICFDGSLDIVCKIPDVQGLLTFQVSCPLALLRSFQRIYQSPRSYEPFH